jgi:hypothetical protein
MGRARTTGVSETSNRTVDLSGAAGRRKRAESAFRYGAVQADVPSVVDGLMAAGALLPAQMPSASGGWSPEKRLAAAVLSGALTEIQVHHGRRSHRRRVAEALEWIRSNDTAWPFSFLRLCALFALDPDWVRAAVERWTRMPPLERGQVGLRRAA